MSLSRFGLTVVGAAGLAVIAAPAPAYTPMTTAGFAELSGSVAAASERDSVLDPERYALYREIFAIEGISDRDAAGMAAFYADRDFNPAWVVDGKLTNKAKAAMERLTKAAEDGLDPTAFAIPDPSSIGPTDLEVRVSLAIVTYARQAQIGRVNPSSIDDEIGYEPIAPAAAEVLAAVYGATDPAAVLDAHNPPHAGYKQLRAKLAELRNEKPEIQVEVPAGPLLRPGMTDARVPTLRSRLKLPADEIGADLYDEATVEAVKAFQKDAGLRPDGVVGPGTLSAMNRKPLDRKGEIIANMERWRWMPRDLGRFHVLVDVPGYMVNVIREGVPFYSTRIVVGDPTHRTPIFSDEIEHVIVNPFWNVPLSITSKEMLPTIQRDPSSLTRSNYEVLALIDGRFRIVDPRMVDWHSVNLKYVQIRQRPGDANALGHIKFMFPNKYAVYLHDTPSKSLFSKEYRAYSHGCMRVMDPFAFADALLVEDASLNSGKLKKLIGGPETQMNMSKQVPVHITYFTAVVTDSGEVQFRNDVYGYSAKVQKALGL